MGRRLATRDLDRIQVEAATNTSKAEKTMSKAWTCRPGVLIVAWLAWSLPMDAQKKYVAAFPREGATKLGDTDFLTFWEVLHNKGNPSPIYELSLDQVTITLTEGAVKFTKSDGTSRIEQERLGGVRFESKGTVIQEEGLSDVPSREIVAQLK